MALLIARCNPKVTVDQEMRSAISDAEELKKRMMALFDGVEVPGLKRSIRNVSFETGKATLDFEVDQSLANPLGSVQGGVVATMLDGCIGIAGASKSGGVMAMPCAELKVSFVRPVQPGVVVGYGETIRLGKTVAFIEATLVDHDGKLLARASATAVPSPFPDPLE